MVALIFWIWRRLENIFAIIVCGLGEILFDSFQMTSFCIVKMKLSRRILFNVKNSRMTNLKIEFTLTVLKSSNWQITLFLWTYVLIKGYYFFRNQRQGEGQWEINATISVFFFTIYLKSKSVKATALDLTIFSRNNHEFQVF